METSHVKAPQQLTITECEQLFWLAARRFILFCTYDEEKERHDNGWHIAVNCNDTFYLACADATELKLSDVPKARMLAEKYGWGGVLALCAKIRNEEPLEHLQTDAYKQALAELNEE